MWGNDYVNSFDDVRFHCLRNIISIAKRKIGEIDRQGEQAAEGETKAAINAADNKLLKNSNRNTEQTAKGNIKAYDDWAERAVCLLMTIIMVWLEIQTVDPFMSTFSFMEQLFYIWYHTSQLGWLTKFDLLGRGTG